MEASRVLEILATLVAASVDARVDGGWGVDALLEAQTRDHEDLDLVVGIEDVSTIERALSDFGFARAEDHLPVRFVLRNPAGEQLDFHTVVWDEAGGGVQPQPGGGQFRYPPEGFVCGRIGGREVKCISPEVQVLCHLGYPPGPVDRRDVLALCRRFGLRVPPAYAGRSSGDLG